MSNQVGENFRAGQRIAEASEGGGANHASLYLDDGADSLDLQGMQMAAGKMKVFDGAGGAGGEGKGAGSVAGHGRYRAVTMAEASAGGGGAATGGRCGDARYSRGSGPLMGAFRAGICVMQAHPAWHVMVGTVPVDAHTTGEAELAFVFQLEVVLEMRFRVHRTSRMAGRSPPGGWLRQQLAMVLLQPCREAVDDAAQAQRLYLGAGVNPVEQLTQSP